MKSLSIIAVWLLFSGSVIAQDFGQLGVVDGRSISIQDLQNQQIWQIYQSFQPILRRRLMEFTIDELSQKYHEFQLNVANITEKEAKEFFVKNGLEAQGTFEALKKDLMSQLYWVKNWQKVEDLYKVAVDKGLARNLIPNVGPFMVKTKLDPERAVYRVGTVGVIEFFDFQCPHCKEAQKTIATLRQKYKNKVVFSYRYFPMAMRDLSYRSSMAAECVRRQSLDVYEQYKDYVFSDLVNQLSVNLKDHAKRIKGIDYTVFESCLDQDQTRSVIDADLRISGSLGLMATPSFVVGHYNSKTGELYGQLITGAVDENGLSREIENYLAMGKK